MPLDRHLQQLPPVPPCITDVITASPGAARHAAHVDAAPIEPFQQCRQLRWRQTHHAVLDRRPAELGAFEPLGHQADACAVPEQQFHPVGRLERNT